MNTYPFETKKVLNCAGIIQIYCCKKIKRFSCVFYCFAKLDVKIFSITLFLIQNTKVWGIMWSGNVAQKMGKQPPLQLRDQNVKEDVRLSQSHLIYNGFLVSSSFFLLLLFLLLPLSPISSFSSFLSFPSFFSPQLVSKCVQTLDTLVEWVQDDFAKER